jgi:hypothetical protein
MPQIVSQDFFDHLYAIFALCKLRFFYLGARPTLDKMDKLELSKFIALKQFAISCSDSLFRHLDVVYANNFGKSAAPVHARRAFRRLDGIGVSARFLTGQPPHAGS